MKAKSLTLKCIKDYLLLIDEKAEIKEGNYYLTYLGNIYQETKRPFEEDEGVERFTNRNSYKCILAYYPLSKETKELNLPLLPNPFEEINIEDLSEKADDYACYGRPLGEKYLAFKKGFIEGYKTAQSEQFSLEDLKKAYNYGLNRGSLGLDSDFNEYIQSLSIQRLPKEFIPEYINTNSYGSETNGYDSGNFILKTITNSEGKEEIQGTYKY